VRANPASLWPPNHTFRLITIAGATDPDGDRVTLQITAVSQDEPLTGKVDNTSPDAILAPSSNQVFLRAERSAYGDGRFYQIAFTGSDGTGRTCSGVALVTVPHDQGTPARKSNLRTSSLEARASVFRARRQVFKERFIGTGRGRSHSLTVERDTTSVQLILMWDRPGDAFDAVDFRLLHKGKVVARSNAPAETVKQARLKITRERGRTFAIIRVDRLRPGRLIFKAKATKLASPATVVAQVSRSVRPSSRHQR
jgi:hypothetical protein